MMLEESNAAAEAVAIGNASAPVRAISSSSDGTIGRRRDRKKHAPIVAAKSIRKESAFLGGE